MKRKYISKTGPWLEETAVKRSDTIEGVRMVKVMFPLEDESVVEERGRSDDIGDNFPNAIWPVLALAQCFGMMPVVGIHSSNQTSAAFRWRTLRTLFTGVYLLLALTDTLLYLKRIVHLGISAKNMVGLVFFSCCCFCGLLFLFLAQRWETLITAWGRHEAVFLRPPYTQNGWRLSSKVRLTAAFFLSLALLEHLMYYASTIYTYWIKITTCNWDVEDPWKTFFRSEHRHIFKVVPYHFFVSLLVLVFNLIFTFAWNYMDIFVMLLSIGLSTRFKQINTRMAKWKLENIREDEWHEVRTHYVQLCELLEMVDANMAPIILLSCTNNLYFICFQLLNIFNSMPYLINYMYFWYSLLYLIGRTTCVFLCAASIHDASRKPLDFFRHTSSSEWCQELERFSEQVSTEQNALSGMKFFYLTRKLLFGMAGTIVTYELVLLQIDAGTKSTGKVEYCDMLL